MQEKCFQLDKNWQVFLSRQYDACWTFRENSFEQGRTQDFFTRGGGCKA
jgi:hypothetical protein